jgi:hypothetical protein
MFKVPLLTSMLYGGAGAAGQSFADSIIRGAARIVTTAASVRGAL